MATAFQKSAFQNNAFQIDDEPPEPEVVVIYGGRGSRSIPWAPVWVETFLTKINLLRRREFIETPDKEIIWVDQLPWLQQNLEEELLLGVISQKEYDEQVVSLVKHDNS